MSSNTLVTAAPSRMSTWAEVAFPPAARIVAAVRAAASVSMSRQDTCAPASAHPIATASPMPEPPPTTAAVRPSKLNIVVIRCLWQGFVW